MAKPGKYLRDRGYKTGEHLKLHLPDRTCPICGIKFQGYYKCCSPKCHRRHKGIKGWG